MLPEGVVNSVLMLIIQSDLSFIDTKIKEIPFLNNNNLSEKYSDKNIMLKNKF
jgi:hypothetical protein